MQVDQEDSIPIYFCYTFSCYWQKQKRGRKLLLQLYNKNKREDKFNATFLLYYISSIKKYGYARNWKLRGRELSNRIIYMNPVWLILKNNPTNEYEYIQKWKSFVFFLKRWGFLSLYNCKVKENLISWLIKSWSKQDFVFDEIWICHISTSKSYLTFYSMCCWRLWFGHIYIKKVPVCELMYWITYVHDGLFFFSFKKNFVNCKIYVYIDKRLLNYNRRK